MPNIKMINFLGYNANPNFVSMPQIEDDLKEFIHKQHRIALVGLPGSGKSQIAKNFCFNISQANQENKDDLEGVIIWLPFSYPIVDPKEKKSFDDSHKDVLKGQKANKHQAELFANCRAIAQELGIDMVNKADNEIIHAIKHAIKRYAYCLLVIDNAPDPTNFNILAFLADYSGDMIITSHYRNWENIQLINMVKMNQEQATDLYINMLRQKRLHQAQAITNEEKQQIQTIAKDLGGYPLALAQAFAYIISNLGGDISEFLKQESHQLQALEKKVADYALPLAYALDFPLRQLAEADQKSIAANALELLNICSFLSSYHLPMKILKDKDLLGVEDSYQVIKALEDCSLVEVTPQSITMHGEVQKHLLKRLTSEEKERLVNKLLSYFVHHQQVESRRSEIQNQQDALLMPHVIQLLDHCERLNLKNEAMVRLYHSVGCYEMRLDLLEMALEYYQKARGMAEDLLDQNTLNLMADLLDDSKRNNAQAKLVDSNTSTAAESLLEFYGIEILHYIGLMGIRMWHVAQADQTIHHLEVAAKLQLALLKPENKRCADIYYTQRNLAHAYLKNRQDRKSEALFQILKDKKEVNDDPVKKHLSRLDLGRIAKRHQQHEKAVEYLTESLQAIQSVEEKDYPYLNKDKDLAVVLADLGEAELFDAIEKYNNHSINQETYQAKLNLADTHLRQAAEADERYYHKPTSRTMGRIVFLLAKVNAEMNYPLLAKQYIDSAMQIQQQNLESNPHYLKESKELQEAIIKKIDALVPGKKKDYAEQKLKQWNGRKNQLDQQLKDRSSAASAQVCQEYGEICYRFFKKTRAEHDLNGIKDNFTQYLTQDPKQTIPPKEQAQVGKVHYRLGNIHRWQHDPEEAKKSYHESLHHLKVSLKQNPNSSQVKKWLHKTLWSLQSMQFTVTLSNHSVFTGRAALFAASFTALFLLKIDYYHKIKNGNNLCLDKTQLAGEITKALTGIIPKIEDKVEVDLGKTVSDLIDIGLKQHQENRKSKATNIIERLGLGQIEQAAFLTQVCQLLEKNEIVKWIVTTYEKQLDQLTEKGIQDFAHYAVTQMLNHLDSKEVNLTWPVGERLLHGLFITDESQALQTEAGLGIYKARGLLQKSGVATPKGEIWTRRDKAFDKHDIYGYRHCELEGFMSPTSYQKNVSEQEADRELAAYRDHKQCIIS